MIIKRRYKFFLSHSSLGEYQLKYEPDFSDDRSLIFGRDLTFHGILKQVGLNIRFVKDGKHLIQLLYETYGIEAQIGFVVHELNKQKNDYEVYFEGKLLLDTYSIEDFFVKVGVEETGIITKFKNRNDVLVDLQKTTSLSDVLVPAFEKETESVLLHSKTISKKFVGSTGEEEVMAETIPSKSADVAPGIIPGGTREVDWGSFANVGFLTEIGELIELTPFGTVMTDEEPAAFYKVLEPGNHIFNFNFDYTFLVHGVGTPGLKLQDCSSYGAGGGVFDFVNIKLIFKIENDGIEVETITIRDYVEDGCIRDVLKEEQFSHSIQRDLILNDEIKVYVQFTTSALYVRQASFNQAAGEFRAIFRQSTLEIKALTQSPVASSTANSLMLFETWARTAQLITDTPDAFRSSLYGRTDSQPFAYAEDGPASLRAITNGFQIRQFPLADKPIFASIKDLYETCDAIDNIGIGIENGKIVVEKKSYFYSDTIILTLNNVADIKKSVAREYYYNEIELGYSKWENEEVNGLDEFNSKRNWTTIITVIKNKLSKLARYIASGYAIEFTRRKTYAQTSTEDWKYDNDNFIISVVRDGEGFKAKTTEGYDSASFANILDPATAYNLDLSPTRSLIKWGNVIKGSVLKYLDKAVKFSFGTANYDAESKRTDESSVIVEDQNHDPNTFENALWIPEYYEFEAPVRAPQLAAIKANPYGQIQFSSGTSNYKYGYIINVKVNTDENKGTFKLLRANR